MLSLNHSIYVSEKVSSLHEISPVSVKVAQFLNQRERQLVKVTVSVSWQSFSDIIMADADIANTAHAVINFILLIIMVN